jgi:hypothetical protein
MEKVPLFMTRDPKPQDFVKNPHLVALQSAFEEDFSAQGWLPPQEQRGPLAGLTTASDVL